MTNTSLTHTILMIRPISFDLNEETMTSNAFQQQRRTEDKMVIRQNAIAEFDAFVETLRAAEIVVIVVQDTPEPFTPDSIFPNNWISFHKGGQVYTYPMQAQSRRLERRMDILDILQQNHQWTHHNVIQLEQKHEVENRFLEGTGSMVLDRIHKIAYACISPRTNTTVLEEWCDYSGYKAIAFNAFDINDQAIYHTNVLMCVGDHFVVICLDSISNPNERSMLIKRFQETNKEIIDISYKQMNAFAGNMLQLRNKRGEAVLVMSQQAYDVLNSDQLVALGSFNKSIISSPIPTIEKYGGGSARCMMAELFY